MAYNVSDPIMQYVCGNPACQKITPDARKCGGCRLESYCSAECQKAHWPVHKQKCLPLQDEPGNLKSDPRALISRWKMKHDADKFYLMQLVLAELPAPTAKWETHLVVFFLENFEP